MTGKYKLINIKAESDKYYFTVKHSKDESEENIEVSKQDLNRMFTESDRNFMEELESKLPLFKSAPCERCPNKSKLYEPHPCPYAEEINNDYSTLCTCCLDCQHECAMDI